MPHLHHSHINTTVSECFVSRAKLGFMTVAPFYNEKKITAARIILL